MVEQAERLWTYEAVEPGQYGAETVVTITEENVARYAEVALNDDPRYQRPEPTLAMPTMVLSYAVLLREEIAEANGFVNYEESRTARKQTPFAKCEIRWHQPVSVGDVITGTRGVLEKYERRGSRFVTFRVEGINQHGIKAVEYDYTCIFDYAKGQREVPPRSGEPNPQPAEARTWQRRLLDFDSAVEGTALAELSITESQEVINERGAFRLAGRPPSESNIHTDEEFARQNIFGSIVNSGPATMSYVDQMLQLSFPPEAFYNGGSLLMRAITPFRSGDTVTFSGEVTGRRHEGDRGMVECRVRGTNQRGELVCLADASMGLG